MNISAEIVSIPLRVANDLVSFSNTARTGDTWVEYRCANVMGFDQAFRKMREVNPEATEDDLCQSFINAQQFKFSGVQFVRGMSAGDPRNPAHQIAPGNPVTDHNEPHNVDSLMHYSSWACTNPEAVCERDDLSGCTLVKREQGGYAYIQRLLDHPRATSSGSGRSIHGLIHLLALLVLLTLGLGLVWRVLLDLTSLPNGHKSEMLGRSLLDQQLIDAVRWYQRSLCHTSRSLFTFLISTNHLASLGLERKAKVLWRNKEKVHNDSQYILLSLAPECLNPSDLFSKPKSTLSLTYNTSPITYHRSTSSHRRLYPLSTFFLSKHVPLLCP